MTPPRPKWARPLRVVRTAKVFSCPWFDVRRDTLAKPDGTSQAFTYVDHPGAVLVVPVDSAGQIILIRSFRHTMGRWCWEIPAGTLADCRDKSPRSIARRELLEEIGASCRRLRDLGSFYVGNGFARLRVRYYLAMGVRVTAPPGREPLELITRVVVVPPPRVQRMLARGLIEDADSALGLALALPLIPKGILHSTPRSGGRSYARHPART